MGIYKRVLDRRIADVESGKFSLKVPKLRGLRLRLPEKPFHPTPEIFFQEDGWNQITFPQESWSLYGGETAVIPSGMPHGEIYRGSFFSVVYMVQPKGFSLHVMYLDGWLQAKGDRFLSDCTSAITRYTTELTADQEGQPNDLLRRGLYLALLARLREKLDSNVPPEPLGHPLVHRCEALISTHFCRADFSVAWLARELGCSADYLSRVFRKHMGHRLIQVIHQRRIDYAKRLLVESNMNVAETSWACGFQHPSYFDRIFRNYVGLTPSEFRENLEQVDASEAQPGAH